MKEDGFHLIMDINTTEEIINNNKAIIEFMKECIEISEKKLIKIEFHEFKPQGLTAVGFLSESHMSITTYPEQNFIAIDLYACGDHRLDKCIEFIKEKFKPHKISYLHIKRGKTLEIIENKNVKNL